MRKSFLASLIDPAWIPSHRAQKSQNATRIIMTRGNQDRRVVVEIGLATLVDLAVKAAFGDRGNGEDG